jgi:phospholipid/cholesterol/gamma-HCH transport system substrate-binding protein
MNENKNKRNILVGLFIIVGIIFLLAGILMIGNIHETFTKKLKITTLFEDVNGLQVGNNIWFSGVKIGIVKKLRFYGKSQVEVTMKIDINSQQYIRKDAYVKIGTDGLIGNKILIIYGGTSKANEIHEGDTLSVENTFSSDDMINMLQENNKNVLQIITDFKTISKRIVDGEGTIGKLLQDDVVYDNINTATHS